ncbi:hypothetical protein F4778DRAFT_601758 [Xylariomycetidae sp. FL2044]|nr:hypothetical protein F4778DRAFT_601758 [Xylariomycetidae sp. FL2044]
MGNWGSRDVSGLTFLLRIVLTTTKSLWLRRPGRRQESDGLASWQGCQTPIITGSSRSRSTVGMNTSSCSTRTYHRQLPTIPCLSIPGFHLPNRKNWFSNFTTPRIGPGHETS